MAKTPGTVVDALLRAHRELLTRLRELEAAARAAPAEQASAWSVRLEAVRAVLVEHFRFEEEDGYMAAVLQREPEMERKVEELRQQHRQLLAELDDLQSAAKDAGSIPAEFGDRVRFWVRHVREHESQENLLVQDAFNVSIAAED
jgi:uncharacterized protein YciI